MLRISPNSCGFFDISRIIKQFFVLAGIILVISVVMGIYGGIKAGLEIKKQTEVWSSVRTIATALNTYYVANKRYPPRLETLLEDHEEPVYLSEQSLNIPDYTLRYAATVSSYVLKIGPQEGEGMHFFVDESSDIRFQKGQPATAVSPLYE